MSSPKSFAVVEDPVAVRRRAEELRRLEEARFRSLANVDRSRLTPDDLDLCDRFEARQREVEDINRRECFLLRTTAEDLHAKLQRASATRDAIATEFQDMAVPAVPTAIADAIMGGSDPQRLRSELDRLEAELNGYERTFARICEEHVSRVQRGTLPDHIRMGAGLACYNSDVAAQADLDEQRAVGEVRMRIRMQRDEAAQLIVGRSGDAKLVPSAQTLEIYRNFLGTADFGQRAEILHKLRDGVARDKAHHKAVKAERGQLESERLAIDKRAVLADVCRQMGWRVIFGDGTQSDRLYVSESGFANHLRELRLAQDGKGGARLSLRSVAVEGVKQRLGATGADEAQRRYDLSWCGRDGTLRRFKDALGDSAIILDDLRPEGDVTSAVFPLANLPHDIRNKLEGTKPPEPIAKAL